MPKPSVISAIGMYRDIEVVSFTVSFDQKLIGAVEKKEAAKRVRITNRGYPITLRHSIATHPFEQGLDILYILEWLGHESIKTTSGYMHVVESGFKKFNNPPNDLDL